MGDKGGHIGGTRGSHWGDKGEAGGQLKGGVLGGRSPRLKKCILVVCLLFVEIVKEIF